MVSENTSYGVNIMAYQWTLNTVFYIVSNLCVVEIQVIFVKTLIL